WGCLKFLIQPDQIFGNLLRHFRIIGSNDLIDHFLNSSSTRYTRPSHVQSFKQRLVAAYDRFEVLYVASSHLRCTKTLATVHASAHSCNLGVRFPKKKIVPSTFYRYQLTLSKFGCIPV